MMKIALSSKVHHFLNDIWNEYKIIIHFNSVYSIAKLVMELKFILNIGMLNTS